MPLQNRYLAKSRDAAPVQSLSIILQEIKNHKSKMFEISGGTINSLMQRVEHKLLLAYPPLHPLPPDVAEV